MSHFVQLTLWTRPGGEVVWLKCIKETAQHYGWLDAYPHSEEEATHPFQQRVFRAMPSRKFRPDIGGIPLRICRGTSRHGNPAHLTNRFRVYRGCSNRLLAELAAVTNVPFGWMETMGGQRKPYDWWMSYAISGKIPA